MNTPYSLTPRELTITGFIAEGYSNRQIADKLGIAEGTVKRHLTNIYDKTGQDSRWCLSIFAVAKGIASQPNNPTGIVSQSDYWKMQIFMESVKAALSKYEEGFR